MRIYISGPITIDPEHWREHFADAEEALRRKYPDAEIINPLTLEDDPDYIEAQEHLDGEELYNWVMKRDIRLLMDCSHIYLLKGWSKSNGAQLELSTATRVGIIPLVECPDENMLSTTYDRLGKKMEGQPRDPIDIQKFI